MYIKNTYKNKLYKEMINFFENSNLEMAFKLAMILNRLKLNHVEKLNVRYVMLKFYEHKGG